MPPTFHHNLSDLHYMGIIIIVTEYKVHVMWYITGPIETCTDLGNVTREVKG